MYADRVESGGRRSIKDRLNGNSLDNSTRRRPITGKRQRQDDKWEHDLYDDEPHISNRKVGARDLRQKLQRKASGVMDLREKLSDTMNLQPQSAGSRKQKMEAAKPARKSVASEAAELEIKKVANLATKKKPQQKAEISLDQFLLSLDLEKYSITFQAEEVDMTTLVHMTDEDLKALGIPMGPRKKILLALESRA
ncbi:ankyrin repeat and SAM domain-containing protein 6 [Tripterygium wilfordii]|uniref:Ankyrin repeat and SAM domain-containing protein 6 n=1 Tax=Tripterygium wilfordii TaxID=458696 RepID=A0A7J7DIW3_TRIWF|nr:ankyrin repeat and SAM domain-containing protein 4B [Tripterygium wilfordii]KAF5746305.1 ankyrin repeat and SAM domain-containing protein 6 [Tripterygium wilfordii]